jgi:hypothetical protein
VQRESRKNPENPEYRFRKKLSRIILGAIFAAWEPT